MPHQIASGLCKRCNEHEASVVVRADPLCRDCFIKYVNTKVIKRMETFRVRNASPDKQRRLLLPFSCDVSSATLLHVLDGHLAAQIKRTGRAGFELFVVHVAEDLSATIELQQPMLDRLRTLYPRHQHAIEPLVDEQLPTELDIPSSDANAHSIGDSEINLRRSTRAELSSTSKADIKGIARTETLVQAAKRLECEGILWADTTTSLAEKVLAQSAKGRGFAVPWLVHDGESPFGVSFNHPMRDLLKNEVQSYVDVVGPPLSEIVTKSPPQQKPAKATIDSLMQDYISSVERDYPSIVANVVRTSSKLVASRLEKGTPKCQLCATPVSDGRFGLTGWGGNPESHGIHDERLCYGCARSMHEVAKP